MSRKSTIVTAAAILGISALSVADAAARGGGGHFGGSSGAFHSSPMASTRMALSHVGASRQAAIPRSYPTTTQKAPRPTKPRNPTTLEKAKGVVTSNPSFFEKSREAARLSAQNAAPSFFEKAREAARLSAQNAAAHNPTLFDKAREAAQQSAQNAATTHNPSFFDKAQEAAKQSAQNAAATHNPSLFEKALEAAKQSAQNATAHNPSVFDKAKEAARLSAQNALNAQKAGPVQTPANPNDKVGSQNLPSHQLPPPNLPPCEAGCNGHHPQAPGNPPQLPQNPTPSGGWNAGNAAPGAMLDFGSVANGSAVVVPVTPAAPVQTATPLPAASRPVGSVGVRPSVSPNAQVNDNKCNCLVKEYVEGGGILFMDVCTSEYATAVPTPNANSGNR